MKVIFISESIYIYSNWLLLNLIWSNYKKNYCEIPFARRFLSNQNWEIWEWNLWLHWFWKKMNLFHSEMNYNLFWIFQNDSVTIIIIFEFLKIDAVIEKDFFDIWSRYKRPRLHIIFCLAQNWRLQTQERVDSCFIFTLSSQLQIF